MVPALSVMPGSPFDTRGFSRAEYSVRGVRTVVYSIGEGPSVMYWHGGGTWHGFAWARELQSHRRVLLPYHPGFGESADAPAIGSLDDYLSHYLALFDQLQLSQVQLIGASVGGFMSVHFAMAHPERVGKLILAAPFGLSSPEYPRPDYRNVPLEALKAWFIVDTALVEPFWPDRWIERREREQASGARLLAGSRMGPALASGLRSLTTPTLILWGRSDRILPVGLATLWHAALPHAQVRIVDNAGHLLLDESAEARRELEIFLR
jgi:pimeloyl-ACP methyl ester carboxylesterase